MRTRFAATTAALCVVLLAPFGTASSAEAASHVRFRGCDSGTFTTTPLEAPLVLTEDSAAGRATRLGHYTLAAHEVINLATLEVSEGSYVITTRRGSLSGTYEGTAAATSDPAVITYLATGPITGGTGRYAHARGSITFDGVAHLDTGVLTETLHGRLKVRRHH